jgi:hypothetical protein
MEARLRHPWEELLSVQHLIAISPPPTSWGYRQCGPVCSTCMDAEMSDDVAALPACLVTLKCDRRCTCWYDHSGGDRCPMPATALNSPQIVHLSGIATATSTPTTSTDCRGEGVRSFYGSVTHLKPSGFVGSDVFSTSLATCG